MWDEDEDDDRYDVLTGTAHFLAVMEDISRPFT